MANPTDINEAAQLATTKPSDFGWWGRDEMFDTWGFTGISVHRDSDIAEQSNFRSVIRWLREDYDNFDDIFEIVHMNHWAVGWVQSLVTQVYDENRNVTPWFEEVYEVAVNLAEVYPIFDEQDYGEMEYEESIRNIKYESPNWVRQDDESAHQIFTYLFENGYYLEPPEYLAEAEVICEAAYSLGLINDDDESFDEYADWLNSQFENPKSNIAVADRVVVLNHPTSPNQNGML